MAKGGVQLHVHSVFSFLEGASFPEALVATAARQDIHTLALTDSHRVSGLVPFLAATEAAGIKGIVGAEVVLEGVGRLVLLVPDEAAYPDLMALLTASHLNHRRGDPRVDWETLSHYGRSLIALTGDRGGVMASSWFGGRRREMEGILQRLAAIFPPDHLWLELTASWLPGNQGFHQALVELGERCRLPLVGTAAAHYATKSDFPVFDLLTAIRLGQSLDGVDRQRRLNAENYLKSWPEMAEALRCWPEALRSAERLAERLESPRLLHQRRAPRFRDLPSGMSSMQKMEALVWSGARRRYPSAERGAVAKRIRHELAVIRDLGFADYFLVVWDIAEFARRSGIRFAGRGSAADSVVAYCLGITQVDAFHRELLFERFMSRERRETPDIDIDFDARRRDEVERYVIERYGADHVARVATYQTYRQRLALRETGKAMEFPSDALDRLAKSLPERSLDALIQSWDEVPELRQYEDGERLRQIMKQAARIEGIPRHLGTHLGGVVVSAVPLSRISPLEMSAKGVRIVPFDKRDVEALGLLKLDLLALRTFTAVEEASVVLAQEDPAFSYDAIPLADGATYARLQSGEGVGVFQLESPAQRSLAIRLKPDRWEDIVASLALIRPGPIKGNMVDPFVARRRGEEPVTYLHPDLEPILSKTYGVVLFQEQVIAIATALAGFSAGEADALRRVMTHARSPREMERIGERFRERAQARGIAPEVAATVFDQLVGYASYGFNEAHAAAFAETAYRTAYLLEHHPRAFFLGLLNAEPLGYYPIDVLVVEARRRGIPVRPLDINRSEAGAVPEGDGAIRIGFRFLKGITNDEAAAIARRRPEKGYRHPTEVLERTGIRLETVLKLVRVGAFDDLDPDRGRWLDETHTQNRLGLQWAQGRGQKWPAREIVRADYALLGFGQHEQWLQGWRGILTRQGFRTLKAVRGMEWGRTVQVVGCLIRPHRPPTRSGRLVVFFSLLDETGLLETRLSEKGYQQFGQWLFGRVQPVLAVTGKTEPAGLAAQALEPWYPPAALLSGGGTEPPGQPPRPNGWRR